MKFNDLHYDILCEIFTHYISETMEGPLLLTLVCTKWRDLVVSTPLLWSYITIDESSSENQLKLDMSRALSGNLPVTLALVLPLSTIQPFKDLFWRASSLHIHFDNIEAKPPFGILRNGDETMEVMIRLLREADLPYDGPVIWYHSRAPISISTVRVYSEVFARQQQYTNKDSNGYFGSVYPIFHTLFSATLEHLIYDATRLLRQLTTMTNLQALHLSCEALRYSHQNELSTMTFPRLGELLLNDSIPDASPSNGWALLEELIQWVSAPVLEHVGITAPVYSTLHMLHAIYKRNRPSTLTLNIRPQNEPYRREPLCDGLGYLRHLEVEISVGIITDNRVLIQLEQDILQHIRPNAICTIIIPGCPSKLPTNAFWGLRCQLNLTYKGLHPQKGFHELTMSSVDTLTFETPRTPIGKVQLPRCRKLCYTSHLDIIHHPDSWPTDLEEFNSGTGSFRDSSLRAAGSTFWRLTTVTCTPQVASVLINGGLPPTFQTLTLVQTGEIALNRKSFHALVNAFQKRLSNDYTLGSKLAQLNVQYFPPWFSYLTLVHSIVKRREEAILSVELPGLPHRPMLTGLVSVLSGAPPLTNEAVYKQLVPEAYPSGILALPRICHNCYTSGFECYQLPEGKSCQRFMNGPKVSITRDTIPI